MRAHFICNKEKSLTKSKKKIAKCVAASLLCVLFFLADWIHVLGTVQFTIDEFYAEKTEVDVGEEVVFHWNVIESFSCAYVNFGDGVIEKYDNETFEGIHSYSSEGKFNVTLTVQNSLGEYVIETLGSSGDISSKTQITVKNEAPTFDLSFSINPAYEDEEVTVSAVTVQDSVVDENNLTFVFDFGDGTSNTTSTSSTFAHRWSTAATYPVTVTAIDDQGALNQTTENITIVNKAPEAAFTLGVDLPATYSFSEDIVGKWPFGWKLGPSSSNIFSKAAINVVDGQDSHEKVVKIEGKYYGTKTSIKTNFASQNYGTIEYYFYTSNATADLGFVSLLSDENAVITTFVQNGEWNSKGNLNPNILSQNVGTPQSNTWHHVRVDFRGSTAGEYFNLPPSYFRVIIDGITDETPYSYSGSAVNYLEIGASSRTIGVSYIDAIGLSWDDNYEIGDNFNYLESSYYATHDFRHDTIGSRPKGWTVPSSSPSQTGEYFGTYSFDTSISGWTNVFHSWGCNASWSSSKAGHAGVMYCKDENSAEQNQRVEVYNSLSPQSHGTIEFYLFHNNLGRGGDDAGAVFSLDNGDDTVFSMRFNKHSDGNIGYYNPVNTFVCNMQYNRWYRIRVDIECGTFGYMGLGQYKANIYVNDVKYVSNGNIEGYYSTFNEVTFLSCYHQGERSEFYVDAVGYTWDQVKSYAIGDNKLSPVDVSIDSEENDHGEIVKLQDWSQTSSTSMKNSFIDQTQGTIEFYAKSSDATSQIWSFALMDGENPSLALLMDVDSWKYTIDGGTSYNTLTEMGTPLDNTWYYVKIQFDYGNHHFSVTIDNSTVYDLDLDGNDVKTNNILISTGINAQGLSWFDAIGYSWDPLYKVGYNKISMISYPEKSNIAFSAADTTDTENDLNSLKYLWNFGDNCSGFGKYIVHSYKTSGAYLVSLTVKDDNGAISTLNKTVLIHNCYPSISLYSSLSNITINEGETLVLSALSSDDVIDLAFLEYWWDFDATEFNPNDVNNYTSGGWKNSWVYQDDFSGMAGLMAIDSEGAYNSSVVNVAVKNINPLVSIYDASVIANVSFELYRSSVNKEGDFTFKLLSNDDPCLSVPVNFSGSSELSVYSDKYLEKMTLSKNWKVVVNSTALLPSNSWFKAYVRLQFKDGRELLISSDKLYGESYGNWTFDLNPYWFDPANFEFMYPITFDAQAFDPSIDDVNISLTYSANLIVEINCTNSLPVNKNFSLNETLGTASYFVTAFEQGGKKYANITVSQLIYQESFEDNDFPTFVDFSFEIYPIVDLSDLLEVQLNLSQVSIFGCVSANNLLYANATDDDLGQGSLEIAFDTCSKVEFENLSPALETLISSNGSLENEIEFFVHVADFDQTENQLSSSVASFKFVDLPTLTVMNGTKSGSEIDLMTKDNNYLTITSTASGLYPATYSFTSDTVGGNPAGWSVEEGAGYINVISDKSGHSQVVEWSDTTTSSYVQLRNYFSAAQSSGTIECWYRSEDETNPLRFRSSDYSDVCVLYSSNGKWYYSWSSTEIVGASSALNTWYHLRIDFECTANGSNGLAQYKWHLYINGVHYGDYPFMNNKTNWYSMAIDTGLANTCKGQLDAIGYSWDSNYYIGKNYNMQNTQTDLCAAFHMDNMNSESVLNYLKIVCSVKSSVVQLVNFSLYNYRSQTWNLIDSVWIGQTISEHTIPVLSADYYNDTYDICLRINAANGSSAFALSFDRLRMEYYSSIMEEGHTFEGIFAPEQPNDFNLIQGNSNWNGDLSDSDQDYSEFSSVNTGLYAATYSFTSDADGSVPAGWTKQGYQHADVHGTIGGHNKVLHASDGSSGQDVTIWNYVSTIYGTQTSGTVEFWYYSTKRADQGINFQLLSSDNTCFASVCEYNYRFNLNNQWSTGRVDLNQWYHIRIDFECSTGGYLGLSQYYCNFYVNGTLYPNIPFLSNKTEFATTRIATGYSATPEGYIDALGYSWDPDYEIGDNLGNGNGIAFSANLRLEGIHSDDEIGTIQLKYSYKTNISQIVNISLYNFDSCAYELINSSIHTSFCVGTYAVQSSNYYDAYYRLKVKFTAENSSNLRLDLDQLRVDYNWTQLVNSSLNNYLKTPSQPSDFSLDVGTSDWVGDLTGVDSDYTTFYPANVGEYSATYSFTNDSVGSDPADWVDLSGTGCTAKIIESLDNHNKIYELYDNGNPATACIYNDFDSAKTSGTYEFWIRASDATKKMETQLTYGTTGIIAFGIYGDYFEYYNGGNVNLRPASDNTWYHCRVDFECGTGGYQGLAQYKWHCFINGVEYGDYSFWHNQNSANRLYMYTYEYAVGFYGYADAVGYSWDANYTIGENYYLNPPLDFTAQIELGSEAGYNVTSYDLNYCFKTNASQLIQVSLYNYTANSWLEIKCDTFSNFIPYSYPIPIARTFTNQTSNETIIFHDFFDYGQELLVRIKSVNTTAAFQLLLDQLTVNCSFTPCALIDGCKKSDCYAIEGDYAEFDSIHPDPYHYPATYSLQNDADGSHPSGWSIYEGTDGQVVQIESMVGGHAKVLSLKDDSPNCYSVATNYFSSGQASGTVEWWYCASATSGDNIMDTRFGWNSLGDSETCFRIIYDGNLIQIEHSGGTKTDIQTISANAWYHIKVSWSCASSSVSVYINDVYINSYGFWHSHSTIDELACQSWEVSCDNDRKLYFDAFGYSWDLDYFMGKNRYPLAQINQTLDLELADMNEYRIGGFESAEMYYSFKTSTIQNTTLKIYNFTGACWETIDAVTTSNLNYYNNSILVNSSDYISEDFKIRTQLFAENDTVDEFTLFLGALEVEYAWSPVWADYGYANLHRELAYVENESNQYSFAYYGNSSFDCEGSYLITMTADDGYFVSKKGQLIDIVNPAPYCEIKGFPNVTAEDQAVEFDADLFAYGANGSDYRFAWDWGDGTYSYDLKTTHAWASSGVYNISLYLVDCYGHAYQENATITVLEAPPEIAGPFTFYGAEGQAIVLDMEIYDAFLDEIGLSYEWFTAPNQILANRFSTDKKPVVFLNDGTYGYSLKVTDSTSQVATANVSIVVEDIAPSVLVGNYMYRGTPNGELDLYAYGLDSYMDIDDLKFYWTIAGANYTHTEADETGGRYSHISFDCVNTTIYSGTVKVIDDFGKTGFATFSINVFVDSNGNGLSDQFEYQLGLNYENVTDYSDSDSDFLTDYFELGVSHTNYTNPDTDGDGLWDGFDNSTGIGELTLGTNPNASDTDYDDLSDSFEFFGWNRTTDLGNVTTTSDPRKADTDSDGLDDGEEYLANTDPRNPDTDNDGLEDGEDSYPTKWDGDGDGLSDKMEIDLGTQVNGTDSDSDGLSDGEEVLGWAFKTNPLSADSDHDFLSDSAETRTFSAKIDARRELNVPVSLPFAHDCVKASSAQLSFALSYGEATAEYGIQTVPDVELYITKKENNLLLFNQTYNDSRYVSEVLDLVKILTDLNVSDFNFRGEYVLRINNTNAGCLLEQFELEVAAYLDPNDDDCDDDGLMDGVETSGFVEGSSVIDFADSYGYGNLTTNNGTENAAWEAFSLEIPYVGRVTDASLNLNVSSLGVPIGLGNIAITLVKNELNDTLTDPAILDFTANFYDDHGYSWAWNLDLGAYLANGTIFELYGKYDLQIKVVQTTLTNNTLDNFTISNYSITTDGWRAPEADETWGWSTDPTTVDTDGDGWTDSYEVFVQGTNPLSPDTDADGAWDANDRDPLRDLALEIELKEGYHGSLQWWEHTPELQICVSFKLGGKDYFFATEPEKATESANQYGSKRKALFDSKYYVNVNDKLSAQGNEVALKFELWHEGPKDYCGKSLWDTRLLRESYDYSIGTSGHSSGTETLEEGDHYLKFEVSTLGVERANTVAIHENGTIFNGHYAAQEKVSLVKFSLNDNGDNTPFVSGDNVIVTPTSLFTSTLLNAKLQHQQQEETPLSGAGFSSVDRDEGAESDGATDEVDFFYDAGELTSSAAMELLNSILEFIAGDNGNYSGTYSFENDAIGSLPYGWTNSSTNGTISEVIEKKDGHNTVLQLTDNLIGCENRTNVYTNFTAQTYGAIEGWLYVDEGSARVSLGNNSNIILTFNSTGLYSSNDTFTILASANDYSNEWHHYKVEFECGTGYNYNLSQGEYRVYLDNESIGEYLAKSGTSTITQFGFNTWTSNDTTFYADAIGFSWDANYSIGENYNCGNVTDFYEYTSTKIDGFSPCLMNLPADALKLIVWVRDYENSDQGKKPQNFNAYLEQWWASVWDTVQEEFQKLVDNLVLFFLANFPWAWLLIRAALLILIYTQITILYSFAFLIMISLIGLLSLLDQFITINVSNDSENLVIQGAIIFKYRYKIIYEFSDFLETDIPSLRIYFETTGFSIEYISGFFSESFNGIDNIENPFESSLCSSNSNIPSNSSLQSSAITWLEIWEFLDGLGQMMGLSGGIVGAYAGYCEVQKDPTKEDSSFAIALSSYIGSLALFIASIFIFPDTFSLANIYGLGWGLIGAGIAWIIVASIISLRDHFMKDTKDIMKTKPWKLIAFIDGICGFGGFMFFSAPEFLQNLGDSPFSLWDCAPAVKGFFSLIGGLTSLFTGGAALILLTYRKGKYVNGPKKSKFSLIFGIVSIVIGAIIQGIAYDMILKEN